ncbi:hypothetical protein R1flu_020604 [Riccia fluitans]|uniref:Uncharacterized protein n=1 Tax=Riccia fluitans TaxID=41844 RepID=A0ABD1ZP32_9MARC
MPRNELLGSLRRPSGSGMQVRRAALPDRLFERESHALEWFIRSFVARFHFIHGYPKVLPERGGDVLSQLNWC